MKVRGIIESIEDVVEVNSTFKRRGFVLSYWNNPDKCEHLAFEVVQDRCKLLDGFNPGDKVLINFQLKGKKWSNPDGVTKYFNTLQAWNIEVDTTPLYSFD
jgi:hypothetical protein